MDEYRWIRIWGEHLGFDDDLIRARQRIAAAEHAPLGATHRRHGSNEWVTIDAMRASSAMTDEWARQYE